MGEAEGVGAGLDDVAAEGEPVHDRGAEPRGIPADRRVELNLRRRWHRCSSAGPHGPAAARVHPRSDPTNTSTPTAPGAVRSNEQPRSHHTDRTSLPRDIARRSRTYKSLDDRRTVTLAVGDEVILRRNHRLTKPDGTTVAVRNGMTGRVTATRRREITVELDGTHQSLEGTARVTLPGGYVGAHVDYGYARTVDNVQGATVDHSLFAPSASASAERAYVALSRGRFSNRIYATSDRTWIVAIGRGAATRSPSIKGPASTAR